MTCEDPFWKEEREDGETVYIVAGEWVESIQRLASVAERNAVWSKRLLFLNGLLFLLALYTVWRLDQLNLVGRLLAAGVL